VKQTYVRASGLGVLLSSILIAAVIPIKGCFDNGTCVTIPLLHSKAGFSRYWNWDYRWGLRIVAVVIGVAAAMTAFAVDVAERPFRGRVTSVTFPHTSTIWSRSRNY
jgi:hypothetical protein